MLRRTVEFLSWYGCWILFDWKLQVQDLVCGAVAALLVVVAHAAIDRLTGDSYRPRPSWIRHFRRLPWQIARDTVLVTAEALRRLAGATPRGALHDFDFDPGPDEEVARARRALLTTLITLSPNSVVADVDRAHGAIVLHSLVPSADAPGSRRWPFLQ